MARSLGVEQKVIFNLLEWWKRYCVACTHLFAKHCNKQVLMKTSKFMRSVYATHDAQIIGFGLAVHRPGDDE